MDQGPFDGRATGPARARDPLSRVVDSEWRRRRGHRMGRDPSSAATPAPRVPSRSGVRVRVAAQSSARRLAGLALVVAVSAPLTACAGAGSAAEPSTSPASPATTAPSADAYPITLDNCGFEVTFTQAPQRVVTIKSSTTEMLLALGVGDRIVGTGFPYVGAGIGAPQMIMDAVGLTNIAAGVTDTWASFSWEQVAADDPDVI